MLDHPPHHQRTRGRAAVAFGAGGRLRRLRQEGAAKAMLPRVHASRPEIVFLNTAGGLTGGDDMALSVDLDASASAVATTQTAERIYASLGPPARVEVTLDTGPEADLAWLPQETILFENAVLDRQTTLRLGRGALALVLETLVLGRKAMGETLSAASVIDRRRIEDHAGRPVFVESWGLDARVLGDAEDPAGLAGHRAFATLVLAGPGATDRLETMRGLLGRTPDAAATAVNGCLVIRARAPDAFPLRRTTAALVEALTGRPAPRVWQT